MTSPQTVPVTLAEVARLAGVGRAAVSNWRRRHESFPVRIGGTDASPLFSLDGVEQWLRANDKLKESGERELLWPRFEALGSREDSGLAIAEVGRRMRAARSGGKKEHRLSEAARELVADAARRGRRTGAEETFSFLLQRWLETHVRQVSTTPWQLAELMAQFALRSRATAGKNDELTVFDPACGTGQLLLAAADAHPDGGLSLAGGEKDRTLASLAAVRLAYATGGSEGRVAAEVTEGDALRDDAHRDLAADVVLCNPPFNERNWGYEELATDARWVHGLPPRTEPELAWVQHCVARLRAGGAAALLLPPAVSSRRAGRRIRGALLRSGLLRMVVALPPGAAQPHSVSLHLWVLCAPAGDSGAAGGSAGKSTMVTMVDAAAYGGPDWKGLASFATSVLDALDQPEGHLPRGATQVPLIDVLDETVDLTPARHVSTAREAGTRELAEGWQELGSLLSGLERTHERLARTALSSNGDAGPPTTTVGDLVRAGALELRAGQQPAETATVAAGRGEEGKATVPLLTLATAFLRETSPDIFVTPDDETVVTAHEGDVVLPAVAQDFDAWVHEGPPAALGPQLYALRADPRTLEPHFLAGCLRAPANSRQASTHASSTSRVNVRRLQVLRLPLAEQQRYATVFREVAAMKEQMRQLNELGSGLVREMSDRLVTDGLGDAVPGN